MVLVSFKNFLSLLPIVLVPSHSCEAARVGHMGIVRTKKNYVVPKNVHHLS